MSTSVLAQSLAGSLSPDANTRMQAELSLSHLFTQPETPVELATMCTNHDLDPHLRQSAGINLRKYVSERWSPFFSTWKGSSPPPEVKSQVRAIIFRGLSDPNRKIRTSSAFVVSTIAHSDWPDHYPSLLNDLVSLLQSLSLDGIHGAMQVFTDFSRADLTEDQLLPVSRQLLPVLMGILGEPERHNPLTRARAVSIFRQCVESLVIVKEQHPEAVEEAVVGVIPQWLDAFKILLEIDPLQDIRDPSNWDALAIRIQIYSTISTLHAMMPSTLSNHLEGFLGLALNHLTVLLPAFHQYHVVEGGEIPPPSSTVDDPDQAVSLPRFASSLLDFLAQAAGSSSPRAQKWFSANPTIIPACITTVIGWVQMTEEDEEAWASDSNAFIAEEDEDVTTMSLRVAGFDFVENLFELLPLDTAQTLQVATQTVVRESSEAKNAGKADWWKPMEAILGALGSEATALMECIEAEAQASRPRPFDVETLLTDVVPSLLSLGECPFLQGRAFVFASNFAKFLPTALAGQYLQAALHALEAQDTGIPVKVSAVKSIRNFCRHVDDEELKPFATRIASDLGPFLLQTSDDTLALVLETLVVVVKIDEGSWLSPEMTASLTHAMLDAWRKNSKDPIFLSVLTDVITAIAASPAPGAYPTLVSQILPTLVAALEGAATNVNESWLASSALELVESVIEGGGKGRLGDGFVAALAPALFDCLSKTQDREILVKGTQVVTLIVRKGSDQLLSWHDRNGTPGLHVVLSFVARLLAPKENESSGLFVGDLIIHLIRTTGEAIFPILPELLQAMVLRITTAKSATFIQSLIVPFAFLIRNQRDTVLSLLETTTTPTTPPQNALEIFLRAWCDNAEMFQGFWATRVSTLAMCEMFTSNRPSLAQMRVNGDLIIKPESKDVIMTRSRTKKIPTEYASIPFSVKALKIILHDLQATGIPSQAELKITNAEEDDGDPAWDDEELYQGLKKEEYGFLSEFLNEDDDSDDGSMMEDEDLMEDPITQIDMRTHLLSFLRHCATADANAFSAIASQLTEDEASVMQKALTA